MPAAAPPNDFRKQNVTAQLMVAQGIIRELTFKLTMLEATFHQNDINETVDDDDPIINTDNRTEIFEDGLLDDDDCPATSNLCCVTCKGLYEQLTVMNLATVCQTICQNHNDPLSSNNGLPAGNEGQLDCEQAF